MPSMVAICAAKYGHEGAFLPGKILTLNPDGSFDFKFDDPALGEAPEKGVLPEMIEGFKKEALEHFSPGGPGVVVGVHVGDPAAAHKAAHAAAKRHRRRHRRRRGCTGPAHRRALTYDIMLAKPTVVLLGVAASRIDGLHMRTRRASGGAPATSSALRSTSTSGGCALCICASLRRPRRTAAARRGRRRNDDQRVRGLVQAQVGRAQGC